MVWRAVISIIAWGLTAPSSVSPREPQVLLENPRVRVSRVAAPEAAMSLQPGVVVLCDSQGAPTKASDPTWAEHPATLPGPFLVIEPKASSKPPTEPKSGGEAPRREFKGMSSTPILENEQVKVVRARMEEGGEEGFHTHVADLVLVHVSGGEIEDTANGTTKVNRWKPGDIEFEALGTSHSARNVGHAIEVLIITLKR
jgi:quercetin dioxygenase-like cupin family protein